MIVIVGVNVMDFSFPGAYPHQQIHLTFNKKAFNIPEAVLVYAFYDGKLLFTHHSKRGWELPGGTRKAHEWPINTVIREAYEEAGAELAALEPIGQYIIVHPHQPQHIKTIYIAHVQELHPLPKGFETDDRSLLIPPDADTVFNDPAYSLLLKDNVYRFSLPVALSALGSVQLSTVSAQME